MVLSKTFFRLTELHGENYETESDLWLDPLEILVMSIRDVKLSNGTAQVTVTTVFLRSDLYFCVKQTPREILGTMVQMGRKQPPSQENQGKRKTIVVTPEQAKAMRA